MICIGKLSATLTTLSTLSVPNAPGPVVPIFNGVLAAIQRSMLLTPLALDMAMALSSRATAPTKTNFCMSSSMPGCPMT
jgi:hypothetical protein